YDVLSGDGKPHEYQWLGHFQPTHSASSGQAQLTVDAKTKAVSTAAVGGKRLWLIPSEPDSFELQQRALPIDARDGNEKPPMTAHRKIGPYVALVKSGVAKPTAFAVLLHPSDADATAPSIEKLDTTED